MNFILIFVLVVILCAGLIFLLVRNKFIGKHHISEMKTCIGSGTDTCHKIKSGSGNVAAKEYGETARKLKPYLKYFSGRMNPLRRIQNDEYDSAYASMVFDGISKTIRLNCPELFRDWFSVFEKDRIEWDEALYKKKAKELLDILKNCGVQSSDESISQWSDDVFDRYQVVSEIKDGQACEMIDPYWIYEGEVFERGLVRSK